MQVFYFLGIFAVAWFVILVFLMATTMHFAKYYKWKINKWLVGGITAVIWIIVSGIFFAIAGR